MAGAYPYEHLLGHREIRLIELSSTEDSDMIISCTMSIAFLDEEPHYEALSYTWDSDFPQGELYTIRCSDVSIFVKANLFNALKRLRPSGGSRTLWIDAICIDQSNLQEKGEQVALMSEIYALAEEVIIWLGEEEETDTPAFDAIFRVEDYFQHRVSDTNLMLDLYHSQEGPHELLRFENPGWSAICQVLRKRWFNRVWVVQEVVMARKALVVCGSHSIPWPRFESIIDRVASTELTSLLLLDGARPQGVNTASVITALQEAIVNAEPFELLEVLSCTLLLQATDPRDKLYSLLGVVAAARKGSPVEKPDYTISSDVLFKRTAASQLKEKGSLKFLSFVEHGSDLTELVPSWVPRWSRPPTGRNPFAQYSKNFATTGSSKPVYRLAGNDCELAVSGLYLDFIKVTTVFLEVEDATDEKRDKFQFVEDTNRKQYHALMTCLKLLEPKGVSYVEVQALPEALGRTLICNMTMDGQLPGSEHDESFEAFYECLRTLCSDPNSPKFEGWDAHDDAWVDRQCRYADLYSQSLGHWNGGRAFCTTTKQRMGMVPRAAKEGDSICVFLGAKTPFVLRPAGNGKYRLVGECYVHGLMSGEIMNTPGFDKKIEEIILI